MIKPTRVLDSRQVLAALHRHPRVLYQKIVTEEDPLARLEDTLLPLKAFGTATYHGVLPVLDWDHRLPSRMTMLRIYAYYSQTTLMAGMAEMQARTEQIMAQDRFPEFDVPDYAGLAADEAYEADVEPDGSASKIRLISSWRREIGPQDARTAIRVTRESNQFRKVSADTKGTRPDHLGDLEAVAWTPPCETGFAMWTVDVWYLTHLDASMGKGRSFLVDVNQGKVAGVREFVVRAS